MLVLYSSLVFLSQKISSTFFVVLFVHSSLFFSLSLSLSNLTWVLQKLKNCFTVFFLGGHQPTYVNMTDLAHMAAEKHRKQEQRREERDSKLMSKSQTQSPSEPTRDTKEQKSQVLFHLISIPSNFFSFFFFFFFSFFFHI